ADIIDRHEFKEGKSRYEAVTETHHDHLIDINSGEIIEFVDDEIEKLKKKIANKLGFELVDHRLELYCKKLK
ncbi:MAG: transcriptional repressor, partial [Pelagibacteraceae bacterium]|nr:transcriptional repressor [Pelagibacteraceae bacterium]